MTPPEKMILLITTIFMLGLGTAFLWTFHSLDYFRFPWEQALKPRVEIQSNTPEYLLASIDKQSKDVSASELAPYTKALDQLVPKCQESRMALADMSEATREILTKKGAKTNNLELLNGVYQAVQPYQTSQKCESGFALFAMLVNK